MDSHPTGSAGAAEGTLGATEIWRSIVILVVMGVGVGVGVGVLSPTSDL